MSRFVCIHAHFYQPPRESPWLESVQRQASAVPFHDWNERVAAECYAPNAAARILDVEGHVVEVVNNYERISFDAGPTLMRWMQECRPELYEAILEADRRSHEHFGGHGTAIAQAYSHLIQPLANERDRRTQVLWGVQDFRRRFGRDPEGMWLPETAVDTLSLEAMAELGVRYTVLAPGQARRFRDAAGRWVNVGDSVGIEPRYPYRVVLPSGRSIAAFFYDGPIAHAIAFGDLLRSGDRLASRLLGALLPSSRGPQLVHVAVDGETFGHHHRFGEMALAYALRRIEASGTARLTNYGQFLAAFPDAPEVEIVEESSWSCAHGVERWRSDCGCHTGGRVGWNQAWRGPLRDALDWLRDAIAGWYESRTRVWFRDPWEARDEYVAVLLNRSQRREVLERHAGRELTEQEAVAAARALEMQRNAMLMYTSCGWFFNDVSGIETVQVLRYAARAVELLVQLGGPDLEPELVTRLAEARSNRADVGTAADLWRERVVPDRVSVEQVAANIAILSIYEPVSDFHAWSAQVERERERSLPGRRLLCGHMNLLELTTGNSRSFAFLALHLGGLAVRARVEPLAGQRADGSAFDLLCRQAESAWSQDDVPTALARVDTVLGNSAWDLTGVLVDERECLVETLLEPVGELRS